MSHEYEPESVPTADDAAEPEQVVSALRRLRPEILESVISTPLNNTAALLGPEGAEEMRRALARIDRLRRTGPPHIIID